MTAHLAAGDIGGTKTELAIYEITTADRREVREAFPSVFRQPKPHPLRDALPARAHRENRGKS